MESFKLSSRLFSEMFWFSILHDTDTLANYKLALDSIFFKHVGTNPSAGSLFTTTGWS